MDDPIAVNDDFLSNEIDAVTRLAKTIELFIGGDGANPFELRLGINPKLLNEPYRFAVLSSPSFCMSEVVVPLKVRCAAPDQCTNSNGQSEGNVAKRSKSLTERIPQRLREKLEMARYSGHSNSKRMQTDQWTTR